MALTSFKEVQDFINKVLTDNGQIDGVNFAPHKAFWNLTYNDFVHGNVPNLSNPDTGDPMPILVVGNSADSVIIHALQGTGFFDPNGAFSRMPSSGPPFFTDAQIKEIADWIDAGCPE